MTALDARTLRSLPSTARSMEGVVALLLLLGLVMIHATRSPLVAQEAGVDVAWGPLLKQAAKLAVGVLMFALGLSLEPKRLLRLSPWILGATAALLAVVWIPGVGAELNGARRWFAFGPGFQPVEAARVALIIWLAARLERVGPGVRDLTRGLLPTAAVPAALAFLLLMQPDFGSALFFLGLSSLMLLLAGARASHFALVGAVALPFIALYASTSLQHVQYRIEQFLAPGLGHQAEQSLLALGTGGVSGVDLGAGMAQLGYLPMVSSDFILAAIGEQLGFIGTSIVVLSFVLFTLLGGRVALAQPTMGRFLLAAGLTLSIAIQAIVNVAVVTAATPTKGIALPFISAGGSSLALSLFAVGVLVRLARPNPAELDAADPNASKDPEVSHG